MGRYKRRICRCSGSTATKVFHARRRAPSAPRWYWQGGRAAVRPTQAICCWRWCRQHAAVQQTSYAASGSPPQRWPTAVPPGPRAHRAGCTAATLHRSCARRWSLLCWGRTLPVLPGPKMSICSALCLRIPPAQPAAGCFPLVSSCRRPRGSAASSRVSWYCPHSPGWQPAARADPAKNTAAT